MRGECAAEFAAKWQSADGCTALCSIAVSFFDEKDGTEKTVQVPIGQSLLEAAHENEIDLEGLLDMDSSTLGATARALLTHCCL